MDNSLNKCHNYDMESVASALREFSGPEVKDVQIWLRDFHIIADMGKLSESEARTLLLLKLGGKAHVFASTIYKKNSSIIIGEFISEFEIGFLTKKMTKTWEEFINRKTTATKEEYAELVYESNVIANSKLMTIDVLMKLVFSRSPSELRTLMWHISYDNTDWNNFTKRAK